jgi:hypothetical protein
MFRARLCGERISKGSNSSSYERCIDEHQRNTNKIRAGAAKTLWASSYIHLRQNSPEGNLAKCSKKSQGTAPRLHLLQRHLPLWEGRHARKRFSRGTSTGATMTVRRVTNVTCPIHPSGCLAHSTTWFRHLDRPTQRAAAGFTAEGVEPWMVESRVAFWNS